MWLLNTPIPYTPKAIIEVYPAEQLVKYIQSSSAQVLRQDPPSTSHYTFVSSAQQTLFCTLQAAPENGLDVAANQ